MQETLFRIGQFVLCKMLMSEVEMLFHWDTEDSSGGAIHSMQLLWQQQSESLFKVFFIPNKQNYSHNHFLSKII